MRNFIWRNIWLDESQFQLEYVTYCEHLLQKASSHGNWMSKKSFANRIENRPFWSRLPVVSADGISRQLRCVRLQHCSILFAIRVLSIHFSSHWTAIFSDEKILMLWLFMQWNHRHHCHCCCCRRHHHHDEGVDNHLPDCHEGSKLRLLILILTKHWSKEMQTSVNRIEESAKMNRWRPFYPVWDHITELFWLTLPSREYGSPFFGKFWASSWQVESV